MFSGRPFRRRPAASEEELEKLYRRLAEAIEQKEPLRVIKKIVADDPRVLQKKKDSNGWLPLHIAVRYASIEVVQYLADKCPEAMLVKGKNGWPYRGMLPLHVAGKYASVEVVQCLADKCPEAMLVKNDDGWLPLHEANAHKAPLTMVQYLADKCPEALLVKTDRGLLPFHLAAANATLEVVQYLANRRPEALLVKNNDGGLPMHMAAACATLEVVQYLANRRPEALLVKNNDGGLPMHMAAACATLEVVQYLANRRPEALLVKDSTGWLPLHRAVRHLAAPEVIRCLVEHCPEALLVKNSVGDLPLHIAACYASVEVLQYLADKRPEGLVVINNGGALPLHYAAWNSSFDGVQCLADKGPAEALLVKDNVGRLPLHNAVERARLEVVQYLADKGPAEALLVEDKNGLLPLHFAASRLAVSLEVAQYLADKCPEALLIQDKDGRLPLHVAVVYNRSLEVVQCLADKGPAEALLVKDKNGLLPLHLAASRYTVSLEVVQRLVECCPEALLVKSDDGSLPVDMARKHSNVHPDVVVWLETAVRDRRDHDRASNGRSPHAVPAPPSAPDPHAQDRGRIRKAIVHPSHEPTLVSVAYVESIRTETFLGDGFFGTVYKGSDKVLAQEFAIKSINTEILRGGSKQDLQHAMKTFKTEQEALSRFRHPNIAALFAYTDPLAEGNAAGYHLVYELAKKGSLDKYLKDDLGRSRLGSFRRRVQVAIDVMTALQFLHKGNDQIKACFHRDVKSANIVLKRDFTAQLIDCGLAQFVNDDIKTTGIKGTKGYICPQYVRTCEYSAACDVYSFGVVMLELWTGWIQNQKDESGANFNFGEEYIHEDRDAHKDADPAMDLASPLPEFAWRFADKALQCINERSKHRPSGDDVLKTLKAILDECSPSSDRTQGGGKGDRGSNSLGGANVCVTCRTFNSVPLHSVCALCLYREEVRKVFLDMVSTFMVQDSGAPAMEALSKKIEDLGNKINPKLDGLSRQIDDVSGKIDSTLPVLAHLDRRLNNQVPRTFFLVPGDIKSGWQNPRSWLRSTAQKKYYLFFVCPVSQQAIAPPIKLKVAKDWFRKAAPVLASGLFLLQVGLQAGLNVSLDLDGATRELVHVTSDHMRQVLDELSSILKECGDEGLLDRLRSGGSGTGNSPGLSDKDVRELSGDAYELVVEKACEQDGWRSQMEPVRLPPSPKVFWVAKSVAQDPKYEIVKA